MVIDIVLTPLEVESTQRISSSRLAAAEDGPCVGRARSAGSKRTRPCEGFCKDQQHAQLRSVLTTQNKGKLLA